MLAYFHCVNSLPDDQNLTEEQRREEQARRAAKREEERVQSEIRRQLERSTKMRRGMRRASKDQNPQDTSELVRSVSQSFDLGQPGANALNQFKRRTTMQPQHKAPSSFNRGPLARPPSGIKRAVSIAGPSNHSNSNLARSATVSSSSSLQYRGELNQSDVLAGYGMGMAVSAATSSAVVGAGIFATVTGIKRRPSETVVPSGSDGPKRTFSSSLKRRNTASSSSSASAATTVASHQFVFGGNGNSHLGGSMSMNGAPTGSLMDGGDSRSMSVLNNENSRSGFNTSSSFTHSSLGGGAHGSASGPGGGSSLFAKLGAQSGLVKKKTITSSSVRT